jgi:serine/threonine protein kinase
MIDIPIRWDEIKLGEKIGSDSIGDVYSAFWSRLGGNVIAKQYRLTPSATDLQEFKSVMRLSSPELAQICGFCVEPTLSLVLDHSSSFLDLIRNTKIGTELLICWMKNVVAGLHFLHKNDVILCNLKPSNIVINEFGNAQLSFYADSKLKLPDPFSALSVAYSAPELLNDKPEFTRASDVYSLGCILYQIDYRTENPFLGMTPDEITNQLTVKKIPLQPSSQCLPILKTLIQSCASLNPNVRPKIDAIDSKLQTFQMQKLHPGFVESCHPKKDSSWYRQSGYQKSFCNQLEIGGFIPCGSSGGDLFIPGPVENPQRLSTNGEIVCCCFVFGNNCLHQKLKRRWSCCNVERICLFSEMGTIPGCQIQQ